MIFQLSVVLRRTVCMDIDCCFDNLNGSHIHSQAMTSAQVVEMSVNAITNSPSEDYTLSHLDNHTSPTLI